MLGYPGAGKTSIAKIIAKLTGAVHINSDQFRKHMFDNPEHISETEHEQIYNMLDYIAEQILKSGKSVIYDANLNRYAHRQEKYDICKKTGAHAKPIWVQTDVETARKRATKQAGKKLKHRPFGNMKPKTFERLTAQLEEPTKSEKATIVNGDVISEDQIKQAIG